MNKYLCEFCYGDGANECHFGFNFGTKECEDFVPMELVTVGAADPLPDTIWAVFDNEHSNNYREIISGKNEDDRKNKSKKNTSLSMERYFPKNE